MSYIGTQRRDDNLIDWSKIGSDIVSNLQKEEQRRDALKKQIDDDTRKVVEESNKVPLGNNDEINKWATNFSYNIQESLLAMHRSLKNGGIKPKDYSVYYNNMMSNTNNVFDVLKLYNKNSKEALERKQKGESSEAEIQLMAAVESFGNLNSSTPVFNSDGTLVITKLKDGKPVDGADGRITLNQLVNTMNTRVDKYNLNGATGSAVESLGSFTQDVLEREGDATKLALIRSISNPLVMKDEKDERVKKLYSAYEQYEKNIIDQIMSNPWSVSSILYDHAGGTMNGKPLQITFDEEKAAKDNSLILFKFENGTRQPDFTTANGKAQLKKAEEFVKTKIRSQLDKSDKLQAIRPQIPERPYPTQQWQWEAGRENEKSQNAGNMLGYLYSGDGAQLQSGIDYINGLESVKKAKRTPDGVSIIFRNGEEKVIKFKNPDGTLKTKADFVRSATSLVFGKDADINAVVKGSLRTKGSFNETGSAEGVTISTQEPEQTDIVTNISNAISSNVDKIDIGSSGKWADDKDVLSAVTPLLTTLGLSARAFYAGGDGLVVTTKSGKKIEIPIDQNFKDNLKSILKEAIPPNTGDETIGGVLEKIAVGVGVTGAAAKWNKKTK